MRNVTKQQQQPQAQKKNAKKILNRNCKSVKAFQRGISTSSFSFTFHAKIVLCFGLFFFDYILPKNVGKIPSPL